MADALLGGIVINEILVDPNGALNFDTDGNGTANAIDEYVELYNSSGSAIDISGLELWDAGVGQWFTFPSGTILQPGGHALVMSGMQPGGSLPTGGPNDLFFDAGRGSALINNGGDNVTVYDPTNDQFIQATFNGDALDDPVLGASGYSGFSNTATRVGTGENFGNDTDGQSLQRASDGTDVFASDTPTPGTTNVCFANGTLLASPTGQIAVETIRPGDRILTADHGPCPVVWVYQLTWTPADIADFPNLAPVRISAGALGADMPKQDLRVSQQHRVLVQGPVAERMYGAVEVLVSAKSLLALPGVRIELPKQALSYFHIMLERHEIVFANGLSTESLYLGRQALASIPPAALRELETVLGIDLSITSKINRLSAPARPFSEGKKARWLIQRHVKNCRPVVGRPMQATHAL